LYFVNDKDNNVGWSVANVMKTLRLLANRLNRDLKKIVLVLSETVLVLVLDQEPDSSTKMPSIRAFFHSKHGPLVLNQAYAN
jgi:hypothetical protein